LIALKDYRLNQYKGIAYAQPGRGNFGPQK